MHRKPRTAEGFFVLDANAACVDINPLRLKLIVKLTVKLLRVFEKFGLNELRLAFAFTFGGLLDAFACGLFQLAEVCNDTLSGPLK